MNIRIEYLKTYSGKDCSEPIINVEDIKLNLEKLSKALNISNVSNEASFDLTTEEINSAADLFISLNLCPSKFAQLYTKIIMKGPVSKILMLSLDVMKKSPPDFKPKAMKIFSNIVSVLNFQYITTENVRKNSSQGKLELRKYPHNVKGIDD